MLMKLKLNEMPVLKSWSTIKPPRSKMTWSHKDCVEEAKKYLDYLKDLFGTQNNEDVIDTYLDYASNQAYGFIIGIETLLYVAGATEEQITNAKGIFDGSLDDELINNDTLAVDVIVTSYLYGGGRLEVLDWIQKVLGARTTDDFSKKQLKNSISEDASMYYLINVTWNGNEAELHSIRDDKVDDYDIRTMKEYIDNVNNIFGTNFTLKEE